MATMYQKCVSDLVDRIAAQAVELAYLKDEIADLEEKLAQAEKMSRFHQEERGEALRQLNTLRVKMDELTLQDEILSLVEATA